jgi:hypothetical protein
MKRLLQPMFYTFVLVAVLAGLSQVVERSASAEAGTCCLTSADCPGTQLCYAPNSGVANCCTGSGCALKNYCEDKRAD